MELHKILDSINVPGNGISLIDRVEILAQYCRELDNVLYARRTTSTREALLDSLDTRHAVTMMVLADLCIEEDKDDKAMGWQWLAQHGRWPIQYSDGTRPAWSWIPTEPPEYMTRSFTLPVDLHNQLLAPCYSSPRLALEDVVTVIASGKWQETRQGNSPAQRSKV